MVVSELRGEKIDIIPYNEEPARFVAKALSPARVREVIVDDQERQATVIVPDDQLSLAIGRDGQNARLAARLTGWRVDIKSETEFASEEEEVEYEGEEQTDGHCMAVLANGRRCPNAAIGGSSYCGLPAHQALSRFQTNQIAVLSPLAEAEVEILADPDADEGQVSEIIERAEAEFEEPVEEAEEETVAEVDAEEPEAEEPEAEASGSEAAGPVAAEGSSSSQATDEEPPATPPADEASEPQDEAPAETAPAGDEAEQVEDEAVAEEAPAEDESEQAEGVPEEAEQA
jgi:N utilization substance protein A